MKNLIPQIIELIRFTSTDLPPDVEQSLRAARVNEDASSPAAAVMDTILENVILARRKSVPLCQDTGTLIFSVHYPSGWTQKELRRQIREAVREATQQNYLRPNAVHALTGMNTGDNSGDEYYPHISFGESEDDVLSIALMMKGGGCENVSAQARLPDSRIHAGRDLAGVKNAVLDAVFLAQGKGCAPGVIGVGIGGDRGTSYLAAKTALWRRLDDKNPDPVLAAFEEDVLKNANTLGIGPMGFGGKSTLLGVKALALHRLPASYFVSVAYMCWAYRRRRMIVSDNEVFYE